MRNSGEHLSSAAFAEHRLVNEQKVNWSMNKRWTLKAFNEQKKVLNYLFKTNNCMFWECMIIY